MTLWEEIKLAVALLLLLAAIPAAVGISILTLKTNWEWLAFFTGPGFGLAALALYLSARNVKRSLCVERGLGGEFLIETIERCWFFEHRLCFTCSRHVYATSGSTALIEESLWRIFIHGRVSVRSPSTEAAIVLCLSDGENNVKETYYRSRSPYRIAREAEELNNFVESQTGPVGEKLAFRIEDLWDAPYAT